MWCGCGCLRSIAGGLNLFPVRDFLRGLDFDNGGGGWGFIDLW